MLCTTRRPREADVLQPDEYLARFTDTAFGRMRSRSLGAGREGVPPVVTLQGMAVSDYLLPALAVLGGWTRTHLVDLPGLAGSGPAKKRLDVPGYAAAVTAWLDHAAISSAWVRSRFAAGGAAWRFSSG